VLGQREVGDERRPPRAADRARDVVRVGGVDALVGQRVQEGRGGAIAEAVGDVSAEGVVVPGLRVGAHHADAVRPRGEGGEEEAAREVTGRPEEHELRDHVARTHCAQRTATQEGERWERRTSSVRRMSAV
jgi:hypothetical protein